MVSTTLTDNTEKRLSEIVTSSIKKNVIPTLSTTISSSFDEKLSQALGPALNKSVAEELTASLPRMVNEAMQEPDVINNISDLVAHKVTQQVGTQLLHQLRHSIVPAVDDATKTTVDTANQQTEARIADILHKGALERQADSVKLNLLSQLVNGMSTTIKSMSESQTALQNQILELQSHFREGKPAGNTINPPVRIAPPQPAQPPTKPAGSEQSQYDQVVSALQHGDYDTGTVLWLQSAQQAELFDNIFRHIDPAYLRKLSPLVNLSVCATLTTTLATHLNERIQWLSEILAGLDPNHPEIHEVSEKILNITEMRLRTAYGQLSSSNPGHPIVHHIFNLMQTCQQKRESIMK